MSLVSGLIGHPARFGSVVTSHTASVFVAKDTEDFKSRLWFLTKTWQPSRELTLLLDAYSHARLHPSSSLPKARLSALV
jgi:hypothetical protein